MALLEASGIGKNFGETKVLKDISLTLEQGEALAIIGSVSYTHLAHRLLGQQLQSQAGRRVLPLSNENETKC